MKFLTDIFENRKQKKLNQRCIQAAYDGDFKEMLNLVAQGADANCVGEAQSNSGRTVSVSSPAYEAIRQGNMLALSALIDNKLDVNGSVGYDRLLTHALNQNNQTAALLLLDHGAKTDFVLRNLKTPLMLAEQFGMKVVAERIRQQAEAPPAAATAPAPDPDPAPKAATIMKPLTLKKSSMP